jgi:hypothetical protein
LGQELPEGLRPRWVEADLSLNILEKLGMLFETDLKVDESSFLPRFATLHVPGQLPALIQCNQSFFHSEQDHLPFMT